MNKSASPSLSNAWIIRPDGTIERTSLAKLTIEGTIRSFLPLGEQQHSLKAYNVSLEADSMVVNEDAPRLLGMPNAAGIFGAVLLIQRAAPEQPLDRRVAAALAGDRSAMREFNLSSRA